MKTNASKKIGTFCITPQKQLPSQHFSVATKHISKLQIFSLCTEWMSFAITEFQSIIISQQHSGIGAMGFDNHKNLESAHI